MILKRSAIFPPITMQDYKQEFLAFALESGVLRFGEFELKSGRVSPYFFNAGLFNNGKLMNVLADFFASSIRGSGLAFDVLYGPAYKGITLACATAMALAEQTGEDVPYAYNRKEAKDHGEGGNTVGASLEGKIAIIDDVITAGTSISESMQIIEQSEAESCAVFIALDRQEKGGLGELSAVQEVRLKYNIPVVAIATLADLVNYVRGEGRFSEWIDAIEAYRRLYGVQE
jgi:orotate phosphoribosyltransferase